MKKDVHCDASICKEKCDAMATPGSFACLRQTWDFCTFSTMHSMKYLILKAKEVGKCLESRS